MIRSGRRIVVSRFGRPRKLTSHQRQEALAWLQAGETQADIARSYAVDRSGGCNSDG
jgi:transposase